MHNKGILMQISLVQTVISKSLVIANCVKAGQFVDL